MRTFLDEGVITYEGEFHSYRGLFTFARPVQERLPLYIGAMRGPKSMQLAGEVVRRRSQRAGLQQGMVRLRRREREDRRRARRPRLDDARRRRLVRGHLRARLGEGEAAARSIVAFYLSSQPDVQLEAHGVDPDEMKAIVEVLGRGELDKAYELTTPEVAETLSIAGTPEECVAQIKEIESAGVNHMIFCITDPDILKPFTQQGR